MLLIYHILLIKGKLRRYLDKRTDLLEEAKVRKLKNKILIKYKKREKKLLFFLLQQSKDLREFTRNTAII